VQMIVLHDNEATEQQVQQRKLASLGRMSASIAHEIRNPLSAINHASELLSENPGIDPQNRRITEIIREQSQRLNTIVEEVLTISRRTPSNLQNIDFSQWIAAFTEQFALEHRLAENWCDVEISNLTSSKLEFDPNHLQQIIDNLCSNALKYGSIENGSIKIKFNNTDYTAIIEVIDHGPGITAEEAEKIFEPFYTSSVNGTGLGLFICKELATLNHARLEQENLSIQGSCFRLIIPPNRQRISI